MTKILLGSVVTLVCCVTDMLGDGGQIVGVVNFILKSHARLLATNCRDFNAVRATSDFTGHFVVIATE